jgi:hypothetical protein
MFIEKEENEVGVMDESTSDYRNKIEEKQEDMFDPHKLQQNILKENEKSYQNNFIDFGDDDIVEEPPAKQETPQQNILEQDKTEEPSPKKNPRKRAKRDKKAIIDSDEDIKEEQLT